MTKFTKDPSTHPAHGPLTEERLIRVRDELAAAAKRSDGGNLGYMMADAAKAIDELLELRKAGQEPVYQVLGDGSWTDYSKQQLEDLLESKPSTLFRVAYAAPQLPQPAVPDYDALRLAFEATERKSEYGFNLHKYGIGYADEATQLRWEQWVACRAAMLQGAEPVSHGDELPMGYQHGHKDVLEWAARLAEANHPQTGDWLYDDPLELAKAIRKGPDMPAEPVQKLTLREGLAAIRNLGPIDAEKIQAERDALNEPVQGWIPCSERMPVENDIVLVVDDGYFVCEAQYREGEFFSAVRGKGEFFETTCRDVELWMPLPAAPQQEADNG